MSTHLSTKALYIVLSFGLILEASAWLLAGILFDLTAT